MPFRSKAQRRWFHWAESEGLLEKGTAHRWEEHTKKKEKLPEHARKKKALLKSSFIKGFFEKLAEIEKNLLTTGPQIPTFTLPQYTNTMRSIFNDNALSLTDKNSLLAQLKMRPTGVPLTPYNNIATLLGAGVGGASGFALADLLGMGLLGRLLGITVGTLAGTSLGSRMFSKINFES